MCVRGDSGGPECRLAALSMVVKGCTERGSSEVVRAGKDGLLEEVTVLSVQAIFVYVGCEVDIEWRRGGAVDMEWRRGGAVDIEWRRGGAVRVEAESRTWLVGSSVMVQGASGLAESVVNTGSSVLELVDMI